MKKIKVWSMMMLMVMALPLMVACGGDDDAPNNNNPQNPSSSFTSLKGLSVDDINVDASQHTTSVNINSGNLTGCTVLSSTSWCAAEIAGSKVNLQIQENSNDEERSSTITLTQTKDNSSLSFRVIQSPKSLIQVEKDVYEVSEDGGTITIDVKSNVEYSVDLSGIDWITESSNTRALQSSTIYLSVQANNGDSDREATIKINEKNGNATTNVTIKQKCITIVVTPSSVSMHHDDTKQLSAIPTVTNWSVEDDFIAYVDDNGLVTARHVGTTNVIASKGGAKGYCSVTVTPEYTAYDTPILAWGSTSATIMAAETHEYQTTTSSLMIVYDYSFGSYTCIMGYSFDNDMLNGVLAMMPYNATLYLRIGYYLLERYLPIGQKGNDFYFVNAMTPEKVTYAVVFGKSGNYITVTYLPYTPSDSAPTIDRIKTLKRDLKINDEKMTTIILNK